MHVHHMRRFLREMIVHRRNLETGAPQFVQHRSNLALQQHQIAHHHGVFLVSEKRGPRAQREPRLDRQPMYGNVQICPWKSHPIYVAAFLTGTPKLAIDFRGVQPLRRRCK